MSLLAGAVLVACLVVTVFRYWAAWDLFAFLEGIILDFYEFWGATFKS